MRRVSERAKGQGVAHLVNEAGLAVAQVLEAMGVVPEGVGALQLQVHEGMRRVVLGNQRRPSHRQATHRYHVIKHRARPHLQRARGDDAHPERLRCDGLEVLRRGEEGKDFRQGHRHNLAAFEEVDFHLLILSLGRCLQTRSYL